MKVKVRYGKREPVSICLADLRHTGATTISVSWPVCYKPVIFCYFGSVSLPQSPVSATDLPLLPEYWIRLRERVIGGESGGDTENVRLACENER